MFDQVSGFGWYWACFSRARSVQASSSSRMQELRYICRESSGGTPPAFSTSPTQPCVYSSVPLKSFCR